MKFDFLKNKLAKTLLISMLIAVVISTLFYVGLFRTYENNISDAFYSPRSTLDEIVIVAIDDYSIQNLGRFTCWPREYYTKVIDNLNESSVVGIDILFDTRSAYDLELAKSIKDNGKVVLAIIYDDLFFRNEELFSDNSFKPVSALGRSGEDYDAGYVNIYTDADGITRSFYPKISGEGNYNPFSSEIVGKYTGIIPDLEGKQTLINYYDEPGGYEYISFYDVYNDSVDPSYFEGKIVLVGVTSPVEHDDYLVPISNKAMPGVEIHANLVQSILTRDYIFKQDAGSTIGLIFLFAIIAGLVLYKFKIVISSLCLSALIIVYIFATVNIFNSSGVILNVLYPIFTVLMIYIILVVMFYRSEMKSRQWITSAFGRYVSKVVIEHLIKNPDQLILGGERKDITLFFSDIRKFTTRII